MNSPFPLVYLLSIPSRNNNEFNEGILPLKCLKSEMGSFDDPLERILFLNASPTSLLNTPSLSNIWKASAARASAHL